MLGLVHREEGIYVLSEDGKKYRQMDPSQQKQMMIRKMIAAPIMAQVVAELVTSDGNAVSKKDIANVIEEHTRIRGTTVPRRARTLMNWFRWIGEETGVFSVDDDVVRLRITKADASQLSL